MVAEHYRLNALIFGIGYLLCMAALKVPLVLPLPAIWMNRLQTWIAIPLILTFGIVQINVHSALDSLGWLQLAALLLLPIASKLLGNWLGLGWAGAVVCRRQPLARKRAAEYSRLERDRLSQPAAATTAHQPGAVLCADADGPGRDPAAGTRRHAPDPLEQLPPRQGAPVPTVEMERRQVVVIGAGPSGAIAAALLKRKGHDVLVIERQHFPRFSIGESLLSHCLDFVEEAGMLDAVNAAGFQVKNGAAFAWGERYSAFDFGDTFTTASRPPSRCSAPISTSCWPTRPRLQGVEIRYGETIVSVDFDPAKPLLGVRREDGSEYRIEADFVLDASGYGRVLPRLLDLEAPSNFPLRQAVFTHVEDHIDQPDFRPRQDPHHHPPDPARYLVLDHPVQQRPLLGGRGGGGGTLRGPQRRPGRVPARLHRRNPKPGQASWTTPCGTPRPAPSAVTRPTSKPCTGRAFALLGNAAEFLDPVFSSGVTIAMRSASMAAGVLHRQLQGESVDWQSEFAEPLKRGVDTFRCYVEGWYAGTFQDVIYHPGGNAGNPPHDQLDPRRLCLG